MSDAMRLVPNASTVPLMSLSRRIPCRTRAASNHTRLACVGIRPKGRRQRGWPALRRSRGSRLLTERPLSGWSSPDVAWAPGPAKRR